MEKNKQYIAAVLLILFVCIFSWQHASLLTKKNNGSALPAFTQKHGKVLNTGDSGLKADDENFYDTEDEDQLNTDTAFFKAYQTFFEFLFPLKVIQHVSPSETIRNLVSESLYLMICSIKI